MKQIITAIVGGIFSMVLAFNLWAGDFREATWGMSQEQVKQVEKKAMMVDENPTTLKYSGELVGYKATIVYHFSRGKLYKGTYSIEGERIIKYFEILGALDKKYGESFTVGYMTEKWNTPTTKIVLSYQTREIDDSRRCFVEYSSKNFSREGYTKEDLNDL